MARTDRRTLPVVVAASGLVHLGVLVLLAFAHPTLRQAQAPPVFEVTIAPMVLPSQIRREPRRTPAASRPLRPRRVLRRDEASPVAPLVMPSAPAGRDGVGIGIGIHPAPRPPGPRDDLRNALRRSAVGCANADSVVLDKAEREDCLERLGRGAKDAPFYEPPMSRDKRKAFDEAAARKQAYRKYKEANLPSGVSPGGLEMKALPEVWTPRN